MLFIRMLLLAVLLALGSQAHPALAQSAPWADSASVTITYVKQPLNAPLILAKALGMYEEEFESAGYTVKWADLSTAAAQARALREGTVQFASVIGWDGVLLARSRGEPIKAISVFARAPNAFCLMTKNPSVTSVADLKGRTVAGPKGAQLYLLLLMTLERAGLAATDVAFVDMQLPQALTTLLSGGVDAALLAGVGKIQAQAEGARALVCGDGLSIGLLFTAVNENFARAHPDLVRRYIAVHNRALAFLQANPGKAREIITRETGLTEQEVERLLPEYDFTPAVTDSDKQYLASAQEFLSRKGLLTRHVDFGGIFWH